MVACGQSQTIKLSGEENLHFFHFERFFPPPFSCPKKLVDKVYLLRFPENFISCIGVEAIIGRDNLTFSDHLDRY